MAEWYDDELGQWFSSETEQWIPIEEGVLPPGPSPREDYTAPSWKDVHFRFTTGGYTAPSFKNVNFQWFSGFTGVFNIGATITAIPPKDLSAYIKSKLSTYKDLGGEIMAWHIKDLSGLIGAIHDEDLPAFLRAIPPKDLGAYLRVYPQEDLPALIVGWAERNLGAFLKVDIRDYLNLVARIGVYVPRDLRAFIKGWVYESPFDLGANIFAYNFRDLGGIIRAKEFGVLIGIIYGIPPKDLPAFIHGWQEFDLGGIINPFVDFRKDLQALIAGIGGKDLGGIIYGWQLFDLKAIISGYGAADLGALINAVGWANLGAIINATGQAVDLGAVITPRLIKLAVLMQIHTMEHLDLGAVINLQPCYNLGIADLGAYMKIFQKHDLPATIYGFHASIPEFILNIRDLTAVIAVGDHIFDKDAVDDLEIIFNIPGEVLALDDLPIKWWEMVRPMDELGVIFKPGGGVKIPINLTAFVTGIFTTKDLTAYINGITQSPYIFGDPIFGAWEPDYLFTAPYIYNNRVLWERLVEITFFSQVYEYFYQSVSASLWKEDDTEKWVLNVASWLEEQTYLQDKTSLREKLVNNIEQFESVDEAVRYAIDWVISFPRKDLGAQITGLIPPYKDLAGRINPFKVYSRAQNLMATITPFHTRDLNAYMRIRDEWLDLNASLTAT